MSELREAIDRWIEHAISPGHFLTAVLCNDLKEACGRADARNQTRIFEIVSYLYNYAPSACWGSPEKVAAWRGTKLDVEALAEVTELLKDF